MSYVSWKKKEQDKVSPYDEQYRRIADTMKDNIKRGWYNSSETFICFSKSECDTLAGRFRDEGLDAKCSTLLGIHYHLTVKTKPLEE